MKNCLLDFSRFSSTCALTTPVVGDRWLMTQFSLSPTVFDLPGLFELLAEVVPLSSKTWQMERTKKTEEPSVNVPTT